MLLEKSTTITSEVDVTAAKIANLFYLMNEKNYIVLQGSTYCINILLHKFVADGMISEKIQYDVQVPYSKDMKSKFDEEAFDGTGGICFNIFHQDPGFPSEELIRVMKDVGEDLEGNFEVDKMSFTMIVGEPVLNMLTRIHFDWEKMSSGHITFDVSVSSR